jgi:ABC-type antimicrobial peptide transport system permease subunit
MQVNNMTATISTEDIRFPVNRVIQKWFARFFAIVFLALSGLIMALGFSAALDGLMTGVEASQIIIKVVNDCVIAIAVFELAMVINKEYGHESQHDVVAMLRRTLPRFIGTVCVALALEGLIMVIKYSQLDRAGNLYYAIATVVSAAVLLMALGQFLKHVPNE